MPDFKLASFAAGVEPNVKTAVSCLDEVWIHRDAPVQRNRVHLRIFTFRGSKQALAAAEVGFGAPVTTAQIERALSIRNLASYVKTPIAGGLLVPGSHMQQRIGDYCWSTAMKVSANSSNLLVVCDHFLFRLVATNRESEFIEAVAKMLVEKLRDGTRP